MTKKAEEKSTNADIPVIRANTPAEAKRQLQAKGVTLKRFADAHGFKYRTVSEVARGVNKGLYGEGFKVCVAFGLKKAA